ncbi:MAG: hypothetical protein Q9195_002995 [Heterodermia aff. obscurata]
MLLSFFLILGLNIVAIKGDLVCLGWGLINPVVGLICHFKSDTFHAVENATLTAVDEAVQSAKHLAQFDLTHNPVSVAYKFLAQTKQGGLGQGRQSFMNATKDFQEVTVGFAKESANQVVQIYDLAHWNDISFCLISGAGHLITQAAQTARKRAGAPSASNVREMAQDCVSKKLKQIARPAIFKTTSSNQQIGSTISDLATLLIPVGIQEVASAKAAQGAVDLAIPGSEETTRIMKLAGDEDSVAQHFTNEVEAQSVADSMKDPDWVETNCNLCELPLSTNAVITRKSRHPIRPQLQSRGNVMTRCCRVPVTIMESGIAIDTISDATDEGQSVGATSAQSQESESIEEAEPTYDPREYNQIPEAALVPAPAYQVRDVSIADDVQALHNDLDGLSTGLMTWSQTLQRVTSSDEVLSALRNVFTGPTTDPLYQSLEILERDNGLRLTTLSRLWISKSDPVLKPLQDFVNAAVRDAIDAVGKLQKLDAKNLVGDIHFFHIGPTKKALTGVDPRGFHVNPNTMQFVAADTPGLVIKNSVTGTASRAPLVKNTFQLVKGTKWNLEAYTQGLPDGPTWHSVFGPEIAEKGRVSMVMIIYSLIA